MRIELIVSDNILEADILNNVDDPQGYVIDLVREDRDTKAAKRLNGMPDYLAILAQADQSINRFQSREEVDAYISGLRAEW